MTAAWAARLTAFGFIWVLNGKAPRRHHPWKPAACEDCREKAANWGLSEGKTRRWCPERNGSERLKKGCFYVRNGSVTPREEGFA
jgi:hypothetical protein